MFCCKNSKKNSYSLEAFNKIKPENKQQFSLNAKKGQAPDQNLIKRVSFNQRVGESQVPNNKNQLQNLVKGSFQDCIKKKVLKSDYEDLVKKYGSSNQPWTDPNFPPNDKSFGDPKVKVVWKRVSQIIQNPTFVSDNFTPSDILQGKLGNCYFLSAVAGLAEKPYRIKKIFPNTTLNKNGIYMARILHKGVFQEVVVDDYFPCTPKGEPIGAQPAGGTQIWVMILQKCWAKLFGSYNAIDGGLPNEVLHAFSAAPTYNYRVTNDIDELENLWQRMVVADQKDQIICCGTQQTKKQLLQKKGLVEGHAYTILGAYDQSYRMLKIRNPWGSMQWKGSASDNDKKFWSKIPADQQLRLGYNNGDDGIFFMLFQDFQKYFVIVDICEIDDNANYFYCQPSFQSGKPLCFELHTQIGSLTLALTQTSKRQLEAKGQKSNKYAHTILVLARELGNNQLEYVNSKSEGSNYDLYLFAPDLAAGNYVICCIVDGVTSVTDLTLSIYGEANSFITQSPVSSQDFLHKCFLDHARKNQQNRQVLSQNPLEWACFDILTSKCKIGYSVFHLDAKSSKKLGLQFNQSQYQSNTLQLLPPYYGSKNFKLVCNPGEQLIVLFRLKPGKNINQFSLPTPKMFRLK